MTRRAGACARGTSRRTGRHAHSLACRPLQPSASCSAVRLRTRRTTRVHIEIEFIDFASAIPTIVRIGVARGNKTDTRAGRARRPRRRHRDDTRIRPRPAQTATAGTDRQRSPAQAVGRLRAVLSDG